MKIELLRNCSHGGEIVTYLMQDGKSTKIIKVSSTINGIMDLRAEVAGWNWYQQIRYPEMKTPICQVVMEKHNYLKIEIDYIEGKQGEYRKGLIYNRDVIMKIVGHYCDIWPVSQNGMVPLHGDFSLENIIINENGVNIFDWEHFGLDAAPWGFDPIYLLFEALWYNFDRKKRLKKKEIQIVSECIQLLEDQHLSKDIADHPLGFLISFIYDNEHLWHAQVNKFPVLCFTQEQVCFIDKTITHLRQL
jgi:hypothetical protein